MWSSEVSYQVHIEFESDLPFGILAYSKYANIVGDVRCSYVLAEASAIHKAFEYLDRLYNVILVDLSYRKKSIMLHASQDHYANVIDGLRTADVMLQQ